MDRELQATINWVNEAFRARQYPMPQISPERDLEIDLELTAQDRFIDA